MVKGRPADLPDAASTIRASRSRSEQAYAGAVGLLGRRVRGAAPLPRHLDFRPLAAVAPGRPCRAGRRRLPSRPAWSGSCRGSSGARCGSRGNRRVPPWTSPTPRIGLPSPGRDRVGAVRGLRHLQLAVGRDDQPGPAGAELGDARLLEGFLEGGEATEVAIDLGGESGGQARHRPSATSPCQNRHVVVVLASLVQHRAGPSAPALPASATMVSRLLPARPLLSISPFSAGDIGVVVLAVVELQRLLAHALAGEGGGRIGE